LLAPQLVAASFAMDMRFADVAVSLPVVTWPKAPFVSRLLRFEGYVSPVPLAPPLSIVAAQSPSGLAVAFIYLDSGSNGAAVARMADALMARLDRASESDA